jgi:hypothetical protein
MLKKLRACIWAFAPLFAMTLWADAVATPVTSWVTITAISTGWAGEGIYFTVTPVLTPACNGRLFMPIAATQYKENLALAMLAISQGLTVTVSYDPTACDAYGNIAFVSLGIT